MREIQITDLDPDNLDPENFCSSGLTVHPVAAMFPLLEGKELEELCDDIQASGLANPIVILGDVLLDGRNRLRACAKVEIDPKFTAYSWY
jgi:ParB-like chromosome segregation protein Spo0J